MYKYPEPIFSDRSRIPEKEWKWIKTKNVYSHKCLPNSSLHEKKNGYWKTNDCVAVVQRETCNTPSHHKPGLFYSAYVLPNKIYILLVKSNRPLHG